MLLGDIQLLRSHWGRGGVGLRKSKEGGGGGGGNVRSERSHFKRFQQRIIAAII